MNSSNQSKQLLLSVVGIALLIVAVVGVTYAFFSYSRTSNTNNTITTGTIYFTSSETNLTLSNAFPVSASYLSGVTDNSDPNVGYATVTVSGNTNYRYGVHFTVTAVNVSNAASLPVKVLVTNTGSTNLTYDEASKTVTLAENVVLASGSISSASGTTAVDGETVIKAYFDDANFLITDTATTASAPEGYTNNTDVTGKTFVTTSAWNNKSVTFKIKVEATEGTAA